MSGAERRSRFRRMGGVCKDLALAGFLALFVLVFLFQPFRVEGESMLPRFADHDRILVNKLSYRLGRIARGDVVVFWHPEQPGSSFLKRVIGLPGDLVAIRGGHVIVNGQVLPEPYVPAEFRQLEDRPEVRVGEGYYYLLGDHRALSFDSRALGLVPQQDIHGRVVMSYWPPGHLGLVGRRPEPMPGLKVGVLQPSGRGARFARQI